MIAEWILWGLFGLIIGSFVNVLIARHGSKSILGRSACPKCHRILEWFELFPVLSWLMLRGRCRTCRARISIQYPLVEIACAAGFIGVGLAPLGALPLTGIELIFFKFSCAALIALLVAIAVYDLYHTIIPDIWSYSFAAIALVLMLLTAPSYVAFAAGPLVALPLFALWLYSRGTWMGLGDAKFALGMGWLLGLTDGFIALGLAFFIGAAVGIFILLPLPYILNALKSAGITHDRSGKTFTMKSEVPFGPFLICGLLIVWFAQLYGLGLTMHLVRFLSWS